MDTIRIGNSIDITWKIYDRNGKRYWLDDKTLELWLLSGPYKNEIESFVVQDHYDISIYIDSEQLSRLGVYKLILRVKGESEVSDYASYDLTQMFQIVSTSYTEPGKIILDGGVRLEFTNILTDVSVLTAYEIAVEHGFYGTEEEWLDSLVGPPGPPGPPGDFVPDEEDLTEGADHKLRLKDRTSVDGMGYVILRKGDFASQLTQSDTIYSIRYDFDLRETISDFSVNVGFSYGGGTYYRNGAGIPLESGQTIWVPDGCDVMDSTLTTVLSLAGTYTPQSYASVYIVSATAKTISYQSSGLVTIPSGCVLEFDGGKLSNGIVTCQGTIIDAKPYRIFENIRLNGFENELRSKWFCIVDGMSDDSAAFQNLVKSSPRIALDPGTLVISKTIECNGVRDMYGVETNSEYDCPIILFTGTSGKALYFEYNALHSYVSIWNVYLLGTSPNNADYYTGTIAIDVSMASGYEQDIRFRNCRFERFETAFKSNAKSYYNWFSDCRFVKNDVCILNASPNNLNIERCRFASVNYGIKHTIGGDGPIVVNRCSIEAIGQRFITSSQPLGKVTISNCYVETACDRLIAGEIGSFSAIDNELQIAGTFRVFDITKPVNFILVGNRWVFDETHFPASGKLVSFTNANTSMKTFMWFDSFKHINRTDIEGGNYSPMDWINASLPSIVAGCDPTTGLPISSANVFGAARPASPYSGQVFFDTTAGKPVFYNGTAWVLADGSTA